MNVDELIQNVVASEVEGDFGKMVKLLSSQNNKDVKIIAKNIEEFNLQHEILNRNDKVVKNPDGTIKKYETLHKLILPYQRKIVKYAVAFLFGKPVKLSCNKESERFNKLKELWEDMKMASICKDLAAILFVETEVALLLSPEIIDETDSEGTKTVVERKVRPLVLSRSKGDTLHPYFDEKGDLIAFTRKYQAYNSEISKNTQRVDVYTKNKILRAEKLDKWDIKVDDNLIKKIPVIYYSINECIWEDVKTLINRTETLISKNADTNDYFGSPAVVSKGKVKNAPGKDDVGKFFQVEAETTGDGQIVYGDLSYLTWDRAPESVKLEYDILDNSIHGFTSTPKITTDILKNFSDISGIALKMFFMDSLLTCLDRQELFSQNLKRTVSILKAYQDKFLELKLIEEDFRVEIDFQDPIPINEAELIQMLNVATGGKPSMSQNTAIRKNPLVSNFIEERVNVQEEEKKSNELMQNSFNNFNNSFN